jgi:hypothetical protein
VLVVGMYRAGELALMGAYYVLNWTRSGQTLGMRAWRLRAVSDSGRPLKLALAPWPDSFGCGGLGAGGARRAVALRSIPSTSRLHDRLSRTRVVVLSRS